MSEAEVSSDSKHFTELFSLSVTKLHQIPFGILLKFKGGDTKLYHALFYVHALQRTPRSS